jgi:hypothetical protein
MQSSCRHSTQPSLSMQSSCRHSTQPSLTMQSSCIHSIQPSLSMQNSCRYSNNRPLRTHEREHVTTKQAVRQNGTTNRFIQHSFKLMTLSYVSGQTEANQEKNSVSKGVNCRFLLRSSVSLHGHFVHTALQIPAATGSYKNCSRWQTVTVW